MVVLLEMLRGWRLGLMRQLVRVVAIVAAYASAIFAGRAVLPFLRPAFKMPDVALSVIAGAIVALLAYVVITSIGVVLFRRTSQHQARLIRWLWGSTGAVLGVLFGAFFMWLVVAGVRLIGSLAEAQAHARELAAGATMPVWNQPLHAVGRPQPSPAPADDLVTTLARMKNSLESGVVGETLKELDPLPPATYRTLEKLGAVASNVQSAQRFLNFPGAREIGDHPKVVALRNDPEIADLVAHGRIFELLQNRRLIEAMNDPALRDRISKFDLERALDYALQKK